MMKTIYSIQWESFSNGTWNDSGPIKRTTNISFNRTKVPSGWLVKMGDREENPTTFFPDPNHLWCPTNFVYEKIFEQEGI